MKTEKEREKRKWKRRRKRRREEGEERRERRQRKKNSVHKCNLLNCIVDSGAPSDATIFLLPKPRVAMRSMAKRFLCGSHQNA